MITLDELLSYVKPDAVVSANGKYGIRNRKNEIVPIVTDENNKVVSVGDTSMEILRVRLAYNELYLVCKDMTYKVKL